MRLLADYLTYAHRRTRTALATLAAPLPFRLHHADCRAVMAAMPDASVDAVITDSPYHLTSIVKRFGGPASAPQQFGTDGAYARAARGFMGQTWDGGDIAFDPTLWAEVLRILKPGGYLLSFGGSRTYHRMACAVEDAGFEIRDQIIWLYGSGFPKSKDQGDGTGTALKPAHEPIVMARRPLVGSCAHNRGLYGTGALNIDACRVPSGPVARIGYGGSGATPGYGGGLNGGRRIEPSTAGRFPANVIHDGKPSYRKDADYEISRRANHHPTVKPTPLMRYLARLVTPAGGLIFDPFTGSGSTGKAAMLEGFRFVGAELTAEYIPIAEARINHALVCRKQAAA